MLHCPERSGFGIEMPAVRQALLVGERPKSQMHPRRRSHDGRGTSPATQLGTAAIVPRLHNIRISSRTALAAPLCIGMFLLSSLSQPSIKDSDREDSARSRIGRKRDPFQEHRPPRPGLSDFPEEWSRLQNSLLQLIPSDNKTGRSSVALSRLPKGWCSRDRVCRRLYNASTSHCDAGVSPDG